MITLGEIRDIPEARRLFRLFGIALALWIIFILLLVRIGGMGDEILKNLEAGDNIIEAASTYRSYPTATRNKSQQPGSEPLTAISEIVESMGLRDRMPQLQSNSSGVLLQLERIYGDEMERFLAELEKKGLGIKTAEMRSIPSGEDRVLNATFLVE
jgi:hypothetical protein